MNAAGHTAVVWEDDGNYGNNAHSEVYYRLFRFGGAVCEAKLSAGGTSGTTWRHLTPDVGLDDKGNAVVVRADDPDGSRAPGVPGPGSEHAVFVRRADAADGFGVSSNPNDGEGSRCRRPNPTQLRGHCCRRELALTG